MNWWNKKCVWFYDVFCEWWSLFWLFNKKWFLWAKSRPTTTQGCAAHEASCDEICWSRQNPQKSEHAVDLFHRISQKCEQWHFGCPLDSSRLVHSNHIQIGFWFCPSYHSLVELAELADHLLAELKLQSQTGLSHGETVGTWTPQWFSESTQTC